jgi:hypothetical protein
VPPVTGSQKPNDQSTIHLGYILRAIFFLWLGPRMKGSLLAGRKVKGGGSFS